MTYNIVDMNVLCSCEHLTSAICGLIICVNTPEDETLRMNSGNLKAIIKACIAAFVPKNLAKNKSRTNPSILDSNSNTETRILFETNFFIEIQD